jgi:hypothetical protein
MQVVDDSRTFQGYGGKDAARKGSATRCEIHSPWMNGAHTESPDFRLDSLGEGLNKLKPEHLAFPRGNCASLCSQIRVSCAILTVRECHSVTRSKARWSLHTNIHVR